LFSLGIMCGCSALRYLLLLLPWSG